MIDITAKMNIITDMVLALQACAIKLTYLIERRHYHATATVG